MMRSCRISKVVGAGVSRRRCGMIRGLPVEGTLDKRRTVSEERPSPPRDPSALACRHGHRQRIGRRGFGEGYNRCMGFNYQLAQVYQGFLKVVRDQEPTCARRALGHYRCAPVADDRWASDDGSAGAARIGVDAERVVDGLRAGSATAVTVAMDGRCEIPIPSMAEWAACMAGEDPPPPSAGNPRTPPPGLAPITQARCPPCLP